MSNHFRLRLQLSDARYLSRCMAGLLVAYWHRYRRRYGLVGHLFQGRFRSPAIEAESHLMSCGRYIERNPRAAGMVAEPWQYPWSSAAAYALGRSNAQLAANPWGEALAAEAAAAGTVARVPVGGRSQGGGHPCRGLGGRQQRVSSASISHTAA